MLAAVQTLPRTDSGAHAAGAYATGAIRVVREAVGLSVRGRWYEVTNQPASPSGRHLEDTGLRAHHQGAHARILLDTSVDGPNGVPLYVLAWEHPRTGAPTARCLVPVELA